MVVFKIVYLFQILLSCSKMSNVLQSGKIIQRIVEDDSVGAG